MTQLSLFDAEQWRDIPGYEGLYQVSDHGRVKSDVKSGRILKHGYVRGKYAYVTLSKDKKQISTGVHRLVALAFLGEPPADGMEVNHIDCNTHNNHISNLEYCTRKQNARHAAENGRYKPLKGSRHHNARLTDELVLEIRRLHTEGYRTSDIAREFNVSPNHLYTIFNNKSWRHLISTEGANQ